MKNKTVLAIDIGYGDVKVTFGEVGQISKQFKFTSLIGLTTTNTNIKDDRIFKFKDNHYYIGSDARNLPSDSLIDIKEYKNLEYFAPLFLHYAIKQIGVEPDVIVTGLSIAQIDNSGYFKQSLQDYNINDVDYHHDNIFVLPQGAGAKFTIDEYGSNFPQKQTEFTGDINYIGVDIGFCTNDFFLVTNGKTSPNLFHGHENEGITVIAKVVCEAVKTNFGRNITLKEAKDIIDSGYYELRGERHDYTQLIKELKVKYLEKLKNDLEMRYGNVIDKSKFIFLSGGGSAIFKDSENSFFKIPKGYHEHYNSIGFWLYGCTKI